MKQQHSVGVNAISDCKPVVHRRKIATKFLPDSKLKSPCCHRFRIGPGSVPDYSPGPRPGKVPGPGTGSVSVETRSGPRDRLGIAVSRGSGWVEGFPRLGITVSRALGVVEGFQGSDCDFLKPFSRLSPGSTPTVRQSSEHQCQQGF